MLPWEAGDPAFDPSIGGSWLRWLMSMPPALQAADRTILGLGAKQPSPNGEPWFSVKEPASRHMVSWRADSEALAIFPEELGSIPSPCVVA